MSLPLTTSEFARRKALAAVLIVVGVAVVAMSLLWPGESLSRAAWSDEQAKKYQTASAKLHGLSHELGHAKGEQRAAVRQELKAAQAEYDVLRAELDSALSRPHRWSWTMRLCGVLAIVIGGAILYRLPPPAA
jgi:hypothetical protein